MPTGVPPPFVFGALITHLDILPRHDESYTGEDERCFVALHLLIKRLPSCRGQPLGIHQPSSSTRMPFRVIHVNNFPGKSQ